MGRTTRGISVLSASLWLSACSGGGGISEPGGGSSTLSVDARVSAENRTVNATSAAEFDTALSVRLKKSGAALHGATVKISSDNGEVLLVENTNKDGTYEGAQSGYAGTYSLSAVLGSDSVDGAALTGPSVHSFSAPLLGAQSISGQPLEVKWSPSGAESATLETRELDHFAVSDTGAYTVPAGGLKTADPGKTTEERVRVERSRKLTLGGGVAGSTLEVSVRNEITILVVGQ